MGDIDSTDFDLICTTSEVGRGLIRSVVTETLDSTWNSPTTSSASTSSVIGIVIPVNDKDVIELQGRAKSGDARAYFKQDTTMNNDDIIIDTSPTTSTYRVENIRIMNAGSEEVFKKCILVKIEWN